MLQISPGLILASVVLGFTFVKNTNYALAEKRATAAASLVNGQPEMAMQSINSAITLAPDVGRYHTTRASILDQAEVPRRSLVTRPCWRWRLTRRTVVL